MTEVKEDITAGARAAVIRGLKTLMTPDEGGTKKDYEDFLEKIYNHVIISWAYGKDIAHVIKTTEEPLIEEPRDLTEEDEEKKWKVRLWEQDVDRYGTRVATLAGNKEALYALIIENLSSLTKSKIRSKKGFKKAEEDTDPIWLLTQLEDIMVRFEEVKPKTIAIDEQMHRIMTLKQADATNEDFVKLVIKELKVYEKHGGDFLWGEDQKKRLAKDLEEAMRAYKEENKVEMPSDQQAEQTRVIKKQLKEEIMATAILRRVDKRRYGNLLINMKNNYLMGNNLYPNSVADVLRILDNYEKEWKSSSKPGERAQAARRPGVAFTQVTGDSKITHFRGTNNSFFGHITCKVCKYKGHYKSHCPAATPSGEELSTPVRDDKDKSAEAAVEEE